MQNGCTALDLATTNHHQRVAELLKKRAKEDMLRNASKDGNTKLVMKLLEEGTDVNSCDSVSTVIDNIHVCVSYNFRNVLALPTLIF